MTAPTDHELLDRFSQRMRGIEDLVKDPPARTPTSLVRVRVGRTGSSGNPARRGIVAPALALVAGLLVAVVAVPLLTEHGSTPAASIPISTSTANASVPSDMSAHLRVIPIRDRALPSGVYFGGALDASTYYGRATDATGREVVTWLIGQYNASPFPEISLSSGAYHIAIWWIEVITSVEGGPDKTSGPFGGCATDVDLAGGTTTTLTAHTVGGRPCMFDPPVTSTTPARSPAGTLPPLLPASGFPSEIEGQSVLTGSDMVDRVQQGETTPFLAGGWLRYVIADCLTDCWSGFVLDSETPVEGGAGASPGLSIPLLSPPSIDLPIGPVVLQVHRDSVTSSCASDPGCSPIVVLDQVVWTPSP